MGPGGVGACNSTRLPMLILEAEEQVGIHLTATKKSPARVGIYCAETCALHRTALQRMPCTEQSCSRRGHLLQPFSTQPQKRLCGTVTSKPWLAIVRNTTPSFRPFSVRPVLDRWWANDQDCEQEKLTGMCKRLQLCGFPCWELCAQAETSSTRDTGCASLRVRLRTVHPVATIEPTLTRAI